MTDKLVLSALWFVAYFIPFLTVKIMKKETDKKYDEMYNIKVKPIFSLLKII